MADAIACGNPIMTTHTGIDGSIGRSWNSIRHDLNVFWSEPDRDPKLLAACWNNLGKMALGVAGGISFRKAHPAGSWMMGALDAHGRNGIEDQQNL